MTITGKWCSKLNCSLLLMMWVHDVMITSSMLCTLDFVGFIRSKSLWVHYEGGGIIIITFRLMSVYSSSLQTTLLLQHCDETTYQGHSCQGDHKNGSETDFVLLCRSQRWVRGLVCPASSRNCRTTWVMKHSKSSRPLSASTNKWANNSKYPSSINLMSYICDLDTQHLCLHWDLEGHFQNTISLPPALRYVDKICLQMPTMSTIMSSTLCTILSFRDVQLCLWGA